MKERWHFHRREYNLYPKDYNRIEIKANSLTLLLRDVNCASYCISTGSGTDQEAMTKRAPISTDG